jgi:uncharacterized cupredoxin-like copper-binding protein
MRATRWALAALTGAVVSATGYAVAAADADTEPLGPGVVTVEVGIHHSRFDIGTLRVRPGTLLRFVVHNDDPIDHELVVGVDDVHRRHAHGTERRHPPVPGEVSIAPGKVGLTFFEVTGPDDLVYACHLPGHVQFGMQGTIDVVP